MQDILDRAEQLFCRTIEFASERASNGRLLRRAVHPELYDLTPDDLAALEAAGIDLKLRVKDTHDDAVNAARQTVRAVALSDAANAFVVGLNPANIRWRAILRAYAITVQVPTHKLQLKNDGHKFQEMPPPACQWRRSDGFDEAVVCELFPQVKIPAALLSSNAQ